MRPHFSLVCLVLLAPLSRAQEASPAPEPSALEPGPYVRLVEENAGRALRLELCVRVLEPAGGEGPRIFLASVVHIGEPAYYHALQTLLDARDVVLFEQVGGVHGADPGPLPPGELARVRATERRLRMLAVAVQRFRASENRLPGDLDRVATTRQLELARRDAWDGRVALVPTEDGFELLSLGADGAPGGEGAAADLRLSDQPPLDPREVGEETGLQRTLANALGLVFQLDAVDYGGERWRNSDMSLEQLQDSVRAAGAGSDASALFGALDGSSALARIGGFLIGLLGSSKQGSATLKLLGIEILARAEDLLAAAPRELSALMEVLIEQRNAVGLSDLAAVIEEEPDVRSIAVFYGAAHMADLEREIVAELDYDIGVDAWLAAVRVDTADLGLPSEQVRFLRRTIQRTLDRELGRASGD
jgi:hypothetical protein